MRMCIFLSFLNMETQMSYHLCQKTVYKGYDHTTCGKRSHQGKWDREEFGIVTVGPNTDTRLGDDNPGEGMCRVDQRQPQPLFPACSCPDGSIYKNF